MVIGSGMMAKAFSHYAGNDRVIVFASGVSYSGETSPEAFEREKNALASALRDHRDKVFIYFSTCSIEDKDVSEKPYVSHKLEMERLVCGTHTNYLIFRLPQVVGKSSNRTTIVNYLYDKILNNEPITVWKNAVRYLIDAEDVAKIASYTVDNNRFRNTIVNIAARKYSILEIIHVLEKITGKRAHCTMVDKGTSFVIDNSAVSAIADILNIRFDDRYLERILNKYYAE